LELFKDLILSFFT